MKPLALCVLIYENSTERLHLQFNMIIYIYMYIHVTNFFYKKIVSTRNKCINFDFYKTRNTNYINVIYE